MGRDWADSEDHDALNEFVGCTISEVSTYTDEAGVEWLAVHTSRGRSLHVHGGDIASTLGFTTEP